MDSVKNTIQEVWRHPIGENTVGAWLLAALVFLMTIVVVRVVKTSALRRLALLADRSSTNLDNVAIETLENTRWFFYVALGLRLASKLVRLPEPAPELLSKACIIAVLIQLGVWTQTAIRSSVSRWRTQNDPGSSTMAAAIGFVSRLCVWSIVVLLVLSNLGIEISALIAGLGVGGVAAALAVQSVLGDVFASLSIYFDRPFDIGDFIIVDDYLGSVETVGLRTTRVRSLGGEQIIFSNGDLTRSRIRNYQRMKERRIQFTIGIEYNLPAEKVRVVPGILRDAIERIDNCRFDRAHFKSYGDFALTFEAVYYVLSPDYGAYMDAQQAINFHVMERLEHEGIPFAFPSRTLYLRPEGRWKVDAQQTESTAAGSDAPRERD